MVAKQTGIPWAHHTFNPWTGCCAVPGDRCCDHCYARERWAPRTGRSFSVRRRTTPAYWRQALRWNAEAQKAGERRRVFPHLCDPFDPTVPPVWMIDFLRLIDQTPNLIWMLLTKRPEHIGERVRICSNRLRIESREFLTRPNIRLGVTIGHQDQIDRARILSNIPCAGRFISAEPLLGPLQFPDRMPNIDWIIAGGESGGHARPTHPDWVRSIRDYCADHAIAFYFKQWGGWRPPNVDGSEHWNTAKGRAQKIPAFLVDDVGNTHCFSSSVPNGLSAVPMLRLGKKRAGRLLDGREHVEIPEVFSEKQKR